MGLRITESLARSTPLAQQVRGFEKSSLYPAQGEVDSEDVLVSKTPLESD
jgi:hypothetical protein